MTEITPLKPGTKILKCNSVPGDAHPDNSPGTVVDPLLFPIYNHTDATEKAALELLIACRVAFVEWDDAKGLPVAVAPGRYKIAEE